MKDDQYGEYEYLPEVVIEDAVNGEVVAWGMVIARYSNYAYVYFKRRAVAVHKLDVSTIRIEDFMGEVWADVMNVIETRFTIR